jgi:hypothetical protein
MCDTENRSSMYLQNAEKVLSILHGVTFQEVAFFDIIAVYSENHTKHVNASGGYILLILEQEI